MRKRKIHVVEVTKAIRELAIRSNTELGEDVLKAFQLALEREESATSKMIFTDLIENARIARKERMPLCHDAGLAVVFVEIGQEIQIIGGSLKEAIQDGVRRGYGEAGLQKSVCHCLSRQNTGDNRPAVIYFDLVEGDRFKLTFLPKGGGSENMSRVTVLAPDDGIQGVRDYVVQRVKESGPNPCPPTIVGVGIGGTFEQAGLLAKRSLLRTLGSENPDPDLRPMEHEWLEEINRLGIGPQGVGGSTTSLAVHINIMPCHITTLPVGVDIQCYLARHREIEL